MDIPFWVWAATIGGLIAIIVLDLLIVDQPWRKDRTGPREFSLGQATRWVIFYMTLAVIFGIGLWFFGGSDAGLEFFAGYVTEYSLSVDNLFIFFLIMTGFAVPRAYQHEVLLIGIVIALIMRGAFIAIGAQALNAWSWLFYVFAAFLLYTAYGVFRDALKHEEEDAGKYTNNRFIRFVRRVVPSTEHYHGARLFIRENGKRLATPMFIVIVAIGLTDLMFALDSIPAIFGLTQNTYIIFTANAFALMGLRQLYFLLGGLMERLVYLNFGLAFILAFIAVKLTFHALHVSGVHVPEIGTELSLGIIVGTLAVTAAVSLWKSSRDRRRGITTGGGGDDSEGGATAAEEQPAKS
ncbi:TerC family protein [Allonocardiopsis opalescens]|uniref:Tellurite resistance protein TerC n=1 Tax=Allonocardiopsis opalescens TaxID=1144618 RepID=A0A2T0PPX1_9ACTN|nr:TerC family protein [Allonocardiopsis opalescens]PRX90927.1 tellurite resistance protein TerC [Allonocardiopsis opalescens]